jgi:ATP-dependent helicase/nuclease subunit A
VIRAFAREAGLHAGYSIELDHDIFLSAAIDELISSAPGDTQLRNWLKTYALSNIDEGKAWNFREGVTKLAEESSGRNSRFFQKMRWISFPTRISCRAISRK